MSRYQLTGIQQRCCRIPKSKMTGVCDTLPPLDSKLYKNPNSSHKVSLVDQPKICSTLPSIRDENVLTELASRGIKLTDVEKDTPPIRVLLGADAILGLGSKSQVVNMVTLTLQNIELPKIWNLYVLDIKDPIERKNKTLLEKVTMTHFRGTLKIREDGRYEVALAWLSTFPSVYDKHDLSVRPEDRDFLRFLWWNTKDQSKLGFFRHCQVVFGVTSGPFLLNASIRHHLNSTEFQTEFLQPKVEKLKKGFHVDNLTTSLESIEELKEFKMQTMKIMNFVSFELRWWAHTGIENKEIQNVLGLKWDAKNDELYCVNPKIDKELNETDTEKKLLSIVNSIYDTLGFISLTTLLPKLLLQEAWPNKVDWDEELPDVISDGRNI
ncbi:hypothetical protein HNY73_006314 [Argiope bruennichi]|uniref:Uncharacterized protein n=1 Tax=Argiope bruennichi TaxID=94029 RepID=A0A8T0FM40_ARGBR|nr:hypothetical protein HNY73_006314 [Argiope bruennichi]